MFTKIRHGVELLPVSVEGYSNSDLNMYYSSTYLLYKQGEHYTTCVVSEVSEGDFYINTATNDERVDAESLFRFLIPSGYYQVDDNIIAVNIEIGRGYKKGLNSGGVRMTNIRTRRDLNPLRVFDRILSDQPEDKLISRRLCILDDKVAMYPTDKFVGNISGNTITTPFDKLVDRISETRGDLTCNIQQ